MRRILTGTAILLLAALLLSACDRPDAKPEATAQPAAEGGEIAAVETLYAPAATAEEFRRVLRQGGRFLYVVPGPRHLWELKCLLYDAPYENEERVEVYPGFSLETVTPVEARFTLPTAEDVQALFHMTPYTWNTPRESAARLSAASQLTVTAQFRIHVFRRL